MSFRPDCLATGIGSLPFEAPEKAMQIIRDKVGIIPHWPQLPHLGNDEGFVEQFVAPLKKLGIVVEEGVKLFFDNGQPDWPDKMTEFYSVYLAALEEDEQAREFFAFPPSSAAGFYYFLEDMQKRGTGPAQYVKGQISGPITLGFRLTDQNKRAIYYDEQLRDILVKTLALQGYWQAKKMATLGLPVIIFVDDPGLYAYGASTHITLTREDIIADLKTIYEAIHQAGALAGTHCCAGTDWSILMEAGADIVNFDAYEYFTSMQSYVRELKDFFARGGILAWGIVPTVNNVVNETLDSLYNKFIEEVNYFVEKGINRETILQQSLITPSCGTGTLTPDLAEIVYNLTQELSIKLRGRK